MLILAIAFVAIIPRVSFSMSFGVAIPLILSALIPPLSKNRVPRILAHEKIKLLKTRLFLILTYIFRRRHASP
jgi:uncharacterized protein YqhQ